jgi:hypothetical protein
MTTDLGRDPFALVTVPVPRLKSWFFGLGLIGAEVPTVKRFASEQLQEQIDRIYAALPADKRAVELEVGFDQRGVAVVAAMKLEHGWSLIGAVGYDYGATWGGRVAVRWAGR